MCNKNMEDTLEKSVSSIAEQLDDDYEIVIVDDYSTDNSREVLKKVEKKHEIIRTKFLPQD